MRSAVRSRKRFRAPWSRRFAFAALIAIFALPSAAVAAPPPPSALHLLDGEGWRADDRFSIGWTNAATADPPIVAVHYRVRDPQGEVESAAVRLGWPAQIVY